MIAAIYARIVGAVLCWLFSIVTLASAEGAWILWARTCNVKSQVCGGEWNDGRRTRPSAGVGPPARAPSMRH